MELTGKIIYIGEVQVISEKFSKRDFAIATLEQYSQEIKLELHQDRIDLIDPYKIDEIVTISYNLRGRSYLDKNGFTQYSNTLQAWKIQR
jgi:single-strand DNA-binding protein